MHALFFARRWSPSPRSSVRACALRMRMAFAAVILLTAVGTARTQPLTFVSAFTQDLGGPTGLALDTIDGITYLYVSDHDGGRVFRYNLNDGSRTQIATRGTGNGQFIWPDAIAIEPSTHDLYIADRQLHRITRLTSSGAFVMKWGDTGTLTNRFGHTGAGTAPGQFNGPVGIVIDADGHLYTTEHENHRVQKFRVTRNGGNWNVETLATWGTLGSGPGQFNTPYGIALDGAGHLWVADGFNSRLQKFSPSGDLLGQIVVRGASEPHLVALYVTVDPTGALYAAIGSDPNAGGHVANQRIERITPAGISLGKWGTLGTAPGEFRLPFGIAIHQPTNRAYVADYGNGRIQIFDLGGAEQPPPPAPPPSPPAVATRLVNVSSRQRVTAAEGGRGAIAGFVVGGDAARPVLVRAVGPGLGSLGVADPLANPALRIFDRDGRAVAENDDWSGDIAAVADRVGAFRIGAGSRDAALVATLSPGAYTAHVDSAAGTGVVLLEVYDVAAVTSASGGKLVNLSTRGFVQSGAGQLVAGFVVTGNAPKRLLVRGIGPGLARFGVADALSNPVVAVYASGNPTPLAQNDNWETPQSSQSSPPPSAAELSAAHTAAGAFALDPASRDASLVVTLLPGDYSAVVSGANNETGVALVEVFELPAP